VINATIKGSNFSPQTAAVAAAAVNKGTNTMELVTDRKYGYKTRKAGPVMTNICTQP
jgi:hypothetical protein